MKVSARTNSIVTLGITSLIYLLKFEDKIA